MTSSVPGPQRPFRPLDPGGSAWQCPPPPYGVPEYWSVDLEAERVEVYRLGDGRYGRTEILVRGDRLVSQVLEGFVLDVEELLP